MMEKGGYPLVSVSRDDEDWLRVFGRNVGILRQYFSQRDSFLVTLCSEG